MTYALFDPSKPDSATQNIAQFGTSIRNNMNALRDAAVILGSFAGFNGTPSGGTESQPALITQSKGVERLKSAITYGTAGGEAGNPTVVVYSYSSNSGSTYDVIGTKTIAYTGNGFWNGSTWS